MLSRPRRINRKFAANVQVSSSVWKFSSNRGTVGLLNSVGDAAFRGDLVSWVRRALFCSAAEDFSNTVTHNTRLCRALSGRSTLESPLDVRIVLANFAVKLHVLFWNCMFLYENLFFVEKMHVQVHVQFNQAIWRYHSRFHGATHSEQPTSPTRLSWQQRFMQR